jgi:hypothetical protein
LLNELQFKIRVAERRGLVCSIVFLVVVVAIVSVLFATARLVLVKFIRLAGITVHAVVELPFIPERVAIDAHQVLVSTALIRENLVDYRRY